MKPKGIGALILQQLSPGGSYLNVRAGQKDPDATAHIAIRFKIAVSGAYCRNVDRVVQICLGVDRKTTTQHQAVARSGSDGKNQRVLLQAADPDGIEPLVEDAEGGEKPAHGDGKVGVGDEIRLQIVEVLADPAGVRRAI